MLIYVTDCGNAILNGGSPATDGCSMVCNGNSTEFWYALSLLPITSAFVYFITLELILSI
jgi:hypothetical protein